MRCLAFTCCCAVVLGACSKSENKAAAPDTAMSAAAPAPPPAPPAPTPISAADLNGKWNVKAMNEAGDSTLVTYTMTDKDGSWMVMFPGRSPVAAKVSTDADSVIVDIGPYASVLRKGLKVTTHGVLRMQDGKLVGMTTAHYRTDKADSVRTIKIEATKAQ